MPNDDSKYNWAILLHQYLRGIPLKSLSYEATGDRSLPKFGSLRNYASKNGWKVTRNAFRRQQADDAKLRLKAEIVASVESIASKDDIATAESNIDALLSRLDEPHSPPIKHLDMWEESAKMRKDVEQFTRDRIAVETAKRAERQASRRVDGFGRQIYQDSIAH